MQERLEDVSINSRHFKFVQIKVHMIEEEGSQSDEEKPRQLVIQFSDVSGKMLYNEARAMQSFVTMM